jgi:deazaflavin-dependent oxidoreductase (nitroreductase family)
MTALQQPRAKTPPRIVIRTFWMLHRAAYRLTGGRFGLARPEAGARFGMLWLTTIGRRSGQTRRTMLGYYEDGPNLVTLAMNGWGETDPAWWLNLQARPNAMVELPDGPRAVVARPADGAERDRLWATFGDYAGWGEDLDGLAARRSRPTAVVVLEPADRVGTSRAASGRTALAPGSQAIDPATRTSEVREGRRLRLRHLWLVPGLAIALQASGLAQAHDQGLAPLLLFGIVPHLASLIGMREPRAPGHISTRAVPLFNGMHHPAPPLVLAGLAAAGFLSPFWLVGGLAWSSHIVIDWALAAGSRTPDGAVQRHPVARFTDEIRRRMAPAGAVVAP